MSNVKPICKHFQFRVKRMDASYLNLAEESSACYQHTWLWYLCGPLLGCTNIVIGQLSIRETERRDKKEAEPASNFAGEKYFIIFIHRQAIQPAVECWLWVCYWFFFRIFLSNSLYSFASLLRFFNSTFFSKLIGSLFFLLTFYQILSISFLPILLCPHMKWLECRMLCGREKNKYSNIVMFIALINMFSCSHYTARNLRQRCHDRG